MIDAQTARPDDAGGAHTREASMVETSRAHSSGSTGRPESNALPPEKKSRLAERRAWKQTEKKVFGEFGDMQVLGRLMFCCLHEDLLDEFLLRHSNLNFTSRRDHLRLSVYKR